MSVKNIRICRATDSAIVDAKLYEGLRAIDLTLVERAWTPWRQKLIRQLIEAGIRKADWPQSLHWDWSAKLPELKLLAVEMFAIDFEDEWQAVVMIETSSHFGQLPNQFGKPLVYVEYIETAPWNWSIPQVGLAKKFRGLGTILLRRVIKRSFELGFKGRIGLSSLPQAEGFYSTELGMTRIPASRSSGLDYFELSEAVALENLKKEK